MGKGEKKYEKIETNSFPSFFFSIFLFKRRGENKKGRELERGEKEGINFSISREKGEKEKILNLKTRKIGKQGLKCEKLEEQREEEKKERKLEQKEEGTSRETIFQVQEVTKKERKEFVTRFGLRNK